jgi:hypothetical protein
MYGMVVIKSEVLLHLDMKWRVLRLVLRVEL